MNREEKLLMIIPYNLFLKEKYSTLISNNKYVDYVECVMNFNEDEKEENRK